MEPNRKLLAQLWASQYWGLLSPAALGLLKSLNKHFIPQGTCNIEETEKQLQHDWMSWHHASFCIPDAKHDA